MPAAKKTIKRKAPKTTTKKPKTKSTKKPTKKTASKQRGGGCGCSGKQDGDQKGGSFVDMDALAKLSVPFGLLIAKSGLEDFLKKRKTHKTKKTVLVKTPVKKVTVTQKTVIRSPRKKVVINRRFL